MDVVQTASDSHRNPQQAVEIGLAPKEELMTLFESVK